MTTIEFKSNQKYYTYEEDGRKNNTVRKVDMNDPRFLRLAEIMHDELYFHDTTITIKQCLLNGETTGKSFTRRIRNVCFYEGLCIITWEHKDD